MPGGGLSSKVGFFLFKADTRILCPEMPGLGELGGLAKWRVETNRRIVYQMVPLGGFSQVSDLTNSGPAWSAGGA